MHKTFLPITYQITCLMETCQGGAFYLLKIVTYSDVKTKEAAAGALNEFPLQRLPSVLVYCLRSDPCD